MNATIKIHLDPEEYDPIGRLARELHVSTEAIAYAGLNLVMRRAAEAGVRREIADLSLGRSRGLPAWADNARGVHIYEGKHDE